MRLITLISLLFICGLSYGQLNKVQTTYSENTNNDIVNTNFDSLDTRISTLVDSGSVYETIEFREVEYDTVNSVLGYIIFSADSIWCERPRGVFRRRLDE